MSVMKGKFLQGGKENENHNIQTLQEFPLFPEARFCSTRKLIKHLTEFRKLLPSVKWESQLASEKMGSEPGKTAVNNFGLKYL